MTKPLFDDAKPAKSATPVTEVFSPTAFTAPMLVPSGAGQSLVPSPAAGGHVRPPRKTIDEVNVIGADAYEALKGVSTQLLDSVRAADAGEFGAGLNQVVTLAKGLNPSSNQGGMLTRVRHMFSSVKDRLLAQYNSVSAQIDTLVVELDKKAKLHSGRIAEMEQLYTNNFNYHERLDKAVQQCRHELEQARADYEAQKAIAVADSFDAQVLADHQRYITALEIRIDNLERAKLLSKQSAPKIRMLQDNARSLVEKFGNVKAVTLPAWKDSFMLYLLQQEQREAVNVLDNIDNATEEALRRGADQLRVNTALIAESRNRSIVSLDTLQHVNNQLIGSLEDVQRIENEARQRRAAEKPEMEKLEADLVRLFAPHQR